MNMHASSQMSASSLSLVISSPYKDSAQNLTSRGALDQDKISVVPHGIRLKHPEINQRKGFRNDHGIAESTRMYLYIGALLPRKRLDILLNAWCKAFFRGDNVVLIVKASDSHGGEALHHKL
jgi:glycosyltransferase involved in cell wall biosynthesis